MMTTAKTPSTVDTMGVRISHGPNKAFMDKVHKAILDNNKKDALGLMLFFVTDRGEKTVMPTETIKTDCLSWKILGNIVEIKPHSSHSEKIDYVTIERVKIHYNPTTCIGHLDEIGEC